MNELRNNPNIEASCHIIDIWWVIELPYWFKGGFGADILRIVYTQDAKDNFTLGEIKPTRHQIEH